MGKKLLKLVKRTLIVSLRKEGLTNLLSVRLILISRLQNDDFLQILVLI